MFKILTFKSLTIISAVLCFFLLCGSVLNALSPHTAVFSQSSAQVPVIMYHQITDEPSSVGEYVITTELLRRDFLYLKENNINPISLKQLTDFVNSAKPLPENPVLITFDDGTRAFLTKVVPLLEEFSFPAVVNIIGSLSELYTENGDTDDSYAYLNYSDIKDVFNNPLCEIGCHTYNLHSLSNRRGASRMHGESDEEYEKLIREDIALFQKMYYELTGEKSRYFAYPYGFKNDFLTKILIDEGFTVLLTCRESTNTVNVGGSLYDLGRFNRPSGKSSEAFFADIFK